MIAVLKHELSGYFHSLTAYIFSAFLLAFVGIGALIYNIQSAVANFEYVLGYVCLGFVVIIPILTMRVIAEERKQKTDELLYSLPLRTSQIVTGKYFALLAVFLVPLCIVAVYPLIFAQFGEVYLLTSYGSLFAFFMMGAAMIAAGIFISSLTENQGFAAGIAIPVILLNYYSVTLAEYVSSTAFGSVAAILVIVLLLGFIIRYLTQNQNLANGISILLMLAVAGIFSVDSSQFEGLLPDMMKKLSLFERFYTFVNGVFDLTAIIYYITVIIFFLFLSVQSLEKRRYN
ncbi:MAG: ABC transporter permease [Dorea sp.]|nr:ABC transporter permease [Dorea sp.]